MKAKLAIFLSLGVATVAWAQAPGGYITTDAPETAMAPLTATQIRAVVPDHRGEFTFPAPFGTRAWRITDASDCGGQDCVGNNGYNYWPLVNDNAGEPVFYVVALLKRTKGGHGLTLFKVDKSSGKVTKLGPIFSSARYQAVGMASVFFSNVSPRTLYFKYHSKLLSVNILTHKVSVVFDANKYHGPGSAAPHNFLIKTSANGDDTVFAGILEQTGTWKRLGCLTYNTKTGKFTLAQNIAHVHQCSVDKSGKYLAIVPEYQSAVCKSAHPGGAQPARIFDIATGKSVWICDKTGGGGHFNPGYGSMLMADNWAGFSFARRLWKFDKLFTDAAASGTSVVAQGAPDGGGDVEGGIFFRGSDWQSHPMSGGPDHISWNNAVPTSQTPLADQYACGSGSTPRKHPEKPLDGKILCFLIHAPDADHPDPRHMYSLVVAPTMVAGVNNADGGYNYKLMPKGSIDPTGHYFYWVSNHHTDRQDVFVVEIPYQKLYSKLPTRRR